MRHDFYFDRHCPDTRLPTVGSLLIAVAPETAQSLTGSSSLPQTLSSSPLLQLFAPQQAATVQLETPITAGHSVQY